MTYATAAADIRRSATPASESIHFYNSEALLDRLSRGLIKRSQQVVFLVGAPFSAPVRPGSPGVPDVDGIIDLIQSEFAEDPEQLAALNQEIDRAGKNRYQSAFLFLQGHRGQQTVNEIVRNAVTAARLPGAADYANQATETEAYRLMDLDVAGWSLNPGTQSLGQLVALKPECFGGAVLTTNFDPLIEVAITRADGKYYKTALHSDGNLTQTQASGCHVIHLHGYWYLNYAHNQDLERRSARLMSRVVE